MGDKRCTLSLKTFGHEAGRKMDCQGREGGNQGTYAWILVQKQLRRNNEINPCESWLRREARGARRQDSSDKTPCLARL